MAYFLIQNHPNIKIIVSGLLPRDSNKSSRRKKIEIVNRILLRDCSNRNITFIQQTDGWLNNGELNKDLFFSDQLHLVEAGNSKLASSFIKAIQSTKHTSQITHSTKLHTCKNIIQRDR